MFSSRTDWNFEENLLARLVREQRKRGEAILDLTDTNPTRCGLPAPSWILESLGGTASLVYEPDPKGLAETRSAIARYYQETGSSVDPDAIILTASTSEAYSFLFRLLCNQGDEILVPRPGYPLFDILASCNDIRPVPYDLRYDGEWHIDTDSVRSHFSDRTRAIVTVTPNNPTGSFLKKDEWRALEDIAADRACAVIADEVFSPFPFERHDGRASSLASSSTVLTFTLNGLSKLAGLPQMKLAWITVNGPPTERTEALKRLEMISDSLLSVATPIQHAAPKILREHRTFSDPILDRVRGNYARLLSRVNPGTGISVLACEAGWSSMLQVPATRSDEAWALDLLDHEHILAHPGHFYDCVNGTFLVISLLPRPEIFVRAVDTLARFVTSRS